MTNKVSYFRKKDLIKANAEGIDLGFDHTVLSEQLETLDSGFKYPVLYGWANKGNMSCQIVIGPMEPIILDVTPLRYVGLPVCEVGDNGEGWTFAEAQET